MPRIIITIDTDNAAFQDNPDELEAIFRAIADDCGTPAFYGPILDSNGNRVGEVEEIEQ